jgi:hypothetical protein
MDGTLSYVLFANRVIMHSELLRNLYEEETDEEFKFSASIDFGINTQLPPDIVALLGVIEVKNWFGTCIYLDSKPQVFFNKDYYSYEFEIEFYHMCAKIYKFLVMDEPFIDELCFSLIKCVYEAGCGSTMDRSKEIVKFYNTFKTL